MNGNEFERKLRRFGRERGLEVRLIAHRGKGSHGTIYLENRRTLIKDRRKEIGKGLLRKMCKDLGIDPADLDG